MIVVATLYLLMFFVGELSVRRFRVSTENSRTAEHIIAGLIAAALPVWLAPQQIVILAVMFLLLLLFSKAVKLLTSLHNVRRGGYGEVLFPVGVWVAVSIFLPGHIDLYTVTLLILALADPAARLFGQRFGYSEKTLSRFIGSLVFFVVALIIGSLWLGFPSGLLVAILTTIIERYSPLGFDNVTIVLAAGLMVLI